MISQQFAIEYLNNATNMTNIDQLNLSLFFENSR